MAENKTIQQLNSISSVGSTDMLPLAQSTGNEAVKATIDQLAQAVGELNQTGALSELSLSTSIGKNLLAQRLTEKGAVSTPSDTLIQMSDKLNRLNIADEYNILIGKYKVLSGATKSIGETSDSQYANASFSFLDNTYSVMLWNNTIYVYDRYGDYTSISDIIANCEFSQALTDNITLRQYMVAIQDGSGIIVGGVAANRFDVYDIDVTNKTITLAKTYTSISVSWANNNNHDGLFMSSDRTLVLWHDNSYYSYMLSKLDNTGAVVNTLTITTSSVYAYITDVYFPPNEDAVYWRSYNSSNPYSFCKFTFTNSESGLSGGVITTLGSGVQQLFDRFNGLVINGCACTYNNTKRIVKYTFAVTDLSVFPNTSSNTINIRLLMDSRYCTNSSNVNQNGLPFLFTPIVKNMGDGVFRIYFSWDSYVTYNRTNNTLTAQNSDENYVYYSCDYSTYDNLLVGVIAFQTTNSGKTILGRYFFNNIGYADYNNFTSRAYRVYQADLENDYCCGFYTNFNNVVYYYTISDLYDSADGKFTPNTTRIELVEDN